MGVLLLIWVIMARPGRDLKLIFCDVGQGDAILISRGKFQMLIDTGPKKGGVMSCLAKHIPFWDREIEVVVNTHPQVDHFGEMGEVMSHYQIGELLVSGELPVGKVMENIYKTIKENQIRQYRVKKGDRIRYGDLSFDVLWSGQNGGPQILGKSTDNNEGAIVLALHSPAMSALFTSDIGESQELALKEEGVLTQVDILKVAHHGSKFSSSLAFDEIVKPKWAVVSVGARNSYGHPAAETLKRFDILGASVLRTDKRGEIAFESDGKRLWVIE